MRVALALFSSEMQRPPLSVRHNNEALEAYRELHEGIPDWMMQGVGEWAVQVLSHASDLQAAEQYFRIGLDWAAIQSSHEEGVAQLLAFEDLDVLDYCLGIYYHPDHAAELREILDRSGSAWTVGTDDDEGLWCLKRRVDVTVLAAANEEMEQRSNAAEYLRRAWHHVYGRNPNPSTAYHDAVRAVEAAARPGRDPNDDRATLGKMILALEDKPGKWETVIGDVDTVRKMMATIWKSQSDRHGTDDTTRSLNVSQPAAEAAVQMAVTLVQLFRTGAIRREHDSL